jgi:peptidoglycan hydrolase-like protein with peptidoglycan-binding domain
MCVEKTRAYVKDNKLKLLNAVVGWGRPVYVGEEDLPLLSKVGSSDAPVTKVSIKTVINTSVPVAQHATPAAFSPLKKGSKGSNVKKVQTALKLKADGVFGDNTLKAVLAFQKANKLDETNGVVGPKTWAAIGKGTK